MTYSILKFLLRKFITSKSVLLQYGDKEFLIDNNTDSLILKINNDKFLRKLFYAPSLVLTEGYMNNDYELPNSSFYEFSEIILNNYNFYLEKISHSFLFKFFLLINPLLQLNFSHKSKNNVASHYDLSDKLYDLFLDDTRQYSCAYFEKEDDSLKQAQLNKMDRLSDKLSLSKNDKVLDIGCGWGSLAIDIAKSSNCEVTGITLSENQFNYCKKRAKELNLENQLNFKLIDYRELNEKFDRIVSVGMFEHVGRKFYGKFFSQVEKLLKDDGVSLIHTIGSVNPHRDPHPWITKYIFPGGYTTSLSAVTTPIEKDGLIVDDIEVLRLHYSHTLRHWKENCIKNKEKIIQMFDEKFFRMWEFYLAGCEMAFKWGDQVVYQFQLTKNYTSTPVTRDYIYQ